MEVVAAAGEATEAVVSGEAATEAVTGKGPHPPTTVEDGAMSVLILARTLHVGIKGPGAASNCKSGTPVYFASS